MNCNTWGRLSLEAFILRPLDQNAWPCWRHSWMLASQYSHSSHPPTSSPDQCLHWREPLYSFAKNFKAIWGIPGQILQTLLVLDSASPLPNWCAVAPDSLEGGRNRLWTPPVPDFTQSSPRWCPDGCPDTSRWELAPGPHFLIPSKPGIVWMSCSSHWASSLPVVVAGTHAQRTLSSLSDKHSPSHPVLALFLHFFEYWYNI